MNAKQPTGWVQGLSGVAILIGLILVAYELRDANQLAEATAYRNRGTEIQEAMQNLALSSDMAEIVYKVGSEGLAALSEVEKARLQSWELAKLLRMQNQFNDYRLGYLDESSYLSMMSAATESLPLWQQIGAELGNPEFIQAIQAEQLRKLEGR